jgi:hypothetical protein
MNRGFVIRKLGAAFELTILALFAVSAVCAQQSKRPQNEAILFPGFTIKITYSGKAFQTLKQKGETVIAAAYISGDPKKGTPQKYLDELGRISFDDIRTEVPPGEDAVFKVIKLNKKDLDYIDEHGPELVINVFSGRKSSQFNLISCEPYEDSLKSAENKTIEIHCELIGEAGAAGV